jgi:heterodisulfide reductase subunit B
VAEATTVTSVSYYPGCSGHGTGVEYDASTKMVCKALGIELHEIEDWNCCGATSAHALDSDLSLALGARNLALAEASGLDQVMVPCAACFNRLRHAAVHVEEQGTPLGLPSVEGRTEVVHLLDVLATEDRLEALEARKFNELHALKVVPYYGCLITRPPEVTGAVDPENPTSMDRLLERMSVEVLRWPYKTRCCGTSLSMTRTDLVEKFSTEIVLMAQRAGAEAIVTACPLCFVNLDTRQHVPEPLPIFYITEVMALYMDADGARSLLRRHQVSPTPLLRSKGMF